MGGGVAITPAPLPNVCGITVGKKGGVTVGGTGKKKNPGTPCAPGGGGSVPEPGSWLLMATGLVLMYWQLRRKLARPLA